MADAGGANLDAGVQMEKRGRDRPRGSKNKPKDAPMVALSSASMKRRPGRPMGSKNKPKVSVAAPGPSAAPRDASPPPPPKIYSFFCIVGAQCREIHRVPLKFTKFMDGRELREVILRDNLGEELPTKWKCTTMGRARCTSGADGPSLQRTIRCINGSSCFSTTIAVRQSLT
jgi:hypothetical protein